MTTFPSELTETSFFANEPFLSNQFTSPANTKVNTIQVKANLRRTGGQIIIMTVEIPFVKEGFP